MEALSELGFKGRRRQWKKRKGAKGKGPYSGSIFSSICIKDKFLTSYHRKLELYSFILYLLSLPFLANVRESLF